MMAMESMPLQQVGPHRHRNADCAEHQRHQRDQRQHAGRAVKRHGDRRIRLAIVGDLRLG